MIGLGLALTLAVSQPVFSASEQKSLPCGWVRFPIDVLGADSKIRVRVLHGTLVVTMEGADVRRTIFIIVDGSEQRISASGPVTAVLPAPRHKKMKIIAGDLYDNDVVYAEVFCLRS